MPYHARADLYNELRPILLYGKASIISGAVLTLLARAYARQFYVLLKQGAGPFMTDQELAWAHFYEASDPFIKPAIVLSWLTFVTSSFLRVLGQSLKYANGIRKGLKGEGSRYQKRRQGAVRLGGIIATIITAFAIGYTQWGFFADLLAPIVMGSGIGAQIAGSIMGAVLAARIVAGLIKWGQGFKNKATNGASVAELIAKELIAKEQSELDVIAENIGVGNSLFHSKRFRFSKKIRAWHLHWVTGKTNTTLGAQNQLPQRDEDNEPIAHHYLNVINHDYYFIVLGMGLTLLLAAALLASPLTLPLTAPIVYFSAAMMGISLGKFLGGMFTRYTGMPNTNTSAWLMLSVFVGLSVTVSVFSFGAPLIAVAAVGVAFSLVSLGLAIKVGYEEYRKKHKLESKQITADEEQIEQNSNIRILIHKMNSQSENTVILVQNYFAAQHKLAHDDYQKNAAKLRRLSLLKEGAKEAARGYKHCFVDMGKLLKKSEWWRKHSILRTCVQIITAATYGTIRVALNLLWIALPFRRLYDYGRKSYKDIKASGSTAEKVAKSIGYGIGLVPVLLNPLYGSHYAAKKEMYARKKQQHKMVMRHAEEAFYLVEKNQHRISGKIEGDKLIFEDNSQEKEHKAVLEKLNAVSSEIQFFNAEQKAVYQEKYDEIERDIKAINHNFVESDSLNAGGINSDQTDNVTADSKKAARITTLFYLGIRSQRAEDFPRKLAHLKTKRPIRVN